MEKGLKSQITLIPERNLDLSQSDFILAAIDCFRHTNNARFVNNVVLSALKYMF